MSRLQPLFRIAACLAALAACATTLRPAFAGAPITESIDSLAVARAALPEAGPVLRDRPAAQPGSALAVGLIATATPALIAAGAAHGGGYEGGLTVALAVTAGVVVGPAVGLTWGGRGDLAGRGMAVRLVGVGVTTLGIASAMSTLMESESGGAGGLGVATVGAAVTCLSAIYDLGITPSAVAEGRPRAALGVRPDGKVAVSVTF